MPNVQQAQKAKTNSGKILVLQDIDDLYYFDSNKVSMFNL
jgi:hypothetical protein